MITLQSHLSAAAALTAQEHCSQYKGIKELMTSYPSIKKKLHGLAFENKTLLTAAQDQQKKEEY